MNGILVRIGVDQAYGGWNAPVSSSTGDFVYVPIPDNPGKKYSPQKQRDYSEAVASLNAFAHRHGLGTCEALGWDDKFLARKMHLDPDFEYLTYGDNGVRRGAGVASLGNGDILVFYAGLRSIDTCDRLVYAMIGLYVVDSIVSAKSVPPARLHENAHTRWDVTSSNDIVVRAQRHYSGRLERCIPIGEWRDKAYRLRADIEQEWGGLSVKNGYLQRSAAPPRLRDAARFYRWFLSQGVSLHARNF